MADVEPFKALAQLDIFKAFELQLRKDFEGAGHALAPDFVLASIYADLLKQMQDQVVALSKNNALPQLLYRIDISENQIKKYTQLQKETSFETVIAELIIKRILQKVIFKIHFSSK